MLLDAPGRELGVEDETGLAGVIDQTSMLESLGRLLPARGDSSIVDIECGASDYSASALARAVEDADVHLVDLLTSPAPDGRIRATLRVRCEDPGHVVASLERYGYRVTAHSGHNSLPAVDMERLLALQALINV